jgi:tetratricopeptide (TPR) repeat protein
MYNQEQWFDRAHNQFLDWLVAGGVPAFLLYLSLFVLAVWAVLRSSALSEPEAGVLLGLLAAYGFSNMFVFDNLVSAFYFFLILAFIHSLSRTELPRWMFLTRPVSDQTVAVVAPIAAIVMFIVLWTFNYGGIVRAQTLISAITQTTATGQPRDPQENLADFKAVLNGGSLGRQEALEQLFQFSSNRVAPDQALDPRIKQEFYTFTLNEGESLLTERPNDARLELFMAMFLSQFGQHNDALAYLNRALDHSPNKQHILFQIGVTHLLKGEVSQALPVLKKAYDLEPKFDTARIYYAAGLLYAGRTNEADQLLLERFNTIVPDDELLLQVYLNTRQFERVVGMWVNRVEKDPNNADMHLGLANALFVAGDKEGAIGELRRVAELRPAMKDQVEELISQIISGALQP